MDKFTLNTIRIKVKAPITVSDRISGPAAKRVIEVFQTKLNQLIVADIEMAASPIDVDVVILYD